MSAGLPGLGLSGLFVLLSALVLPLAHGFRSRTSLGHRVRIAPLLGLTAAITAAALCSWWIVALLVHTVVSSGSKTSSGAAEIYGVPVIVVSLGILAVVLVLPEVLLHTIGTKPTPAVPPVERPRRLTEPPDDR